MRPNLDIWCRNLSNVESVHIVNSIVVPSAQSQHLYQRLYWYKVFRFWDLPQIGNWLCCVWSNNYILSINANNFYHLIVFLSFCWKILYGMIMFHFFTCFVNNNLNQFRNFLLQSFLYSSFKLLIYSQTSSLIFCVLMSVQAHPADYLLPKRSNYHPLVSDRFLDILFLWAQFLYYPMVVI